MPKEKKVMEKEIRDQFLYKGLGFPVVLQNVPMIKAQGVWTPDIDYNRFQRAVLEALAKRHFPLTGNQLQFIRKYFELTLAAFASLFGVSHVAVLKWEKQGNDIAKVQPTTEICIRLFVLEKLKISNEDFRSLYRDVKPAEIAEIQKRRKTETHSDFVHWNLKKPSQIPVRL